ncbi:MAG: phenylalanine--tRNA ligase subunit beta, partial [Acidimicrobiales bacterium]
MRAPLSWLHDYAPFDQSVEVLTDALSNLGLVVEGVARIGGGLGGVVVARVLEIRAHPDADRIRLVDVDAGGPSPLQIVCGAHNFSVGDLVALATVGAVLPGGVEIARRRMRGEISDGMLCSPVELGLPTVAGTDGLLVLPAGLASPGAPLSEALQLSGDVVFDLEISPNRPDAMSMAGVARDLAAALGLPWTPAEGVPWAPAGGPAPTTCASVASLRVEAPELCPRFTATLVDGVVVGPSPAGLARRLTLAGMRPINHVVDVSNYVMLDIGQPNHAYDVERLGGAGLLVRRGRIGEAVTTLDGMSRAVGPEDCLICDAESVPVGIGGIMGGASSEISESSTAVLLEAAWFDPLAIARTGKRLGLHSEARARFEKGVDPTAAPVAVERFVTLLAAGQSSALARGATMEERSDLLPTPGSVEVRTDRVNLVLGTSLSDDDVSRLLSPIGFAAALASPGTHVVQIPSWRLDSTREIDVIEEVARLNGYHNIPRSLPSGGRPGARLTPYQRERRRVKEILAGCGIDEAWTTTFLAPDDLTRVGLDRAAVEVTNPLDHDYSVLRPSLLPGLLSAVRFNVDHQQSDVRLFEVGRVFGPPAEGANLPEEREDVAVVIAAPGVDARWTVWVWRVLSEALRLDGVSLRAAPAPGLHPARSVE